MIQKAMDYAKDIFSGDSSGHDFYHTLRVYNMACRIAREEGADLLTVSLAALLHDVDDRKLSPETCETKARAAMFLHKHGVEEDRIRHILEIISQVSFSSGMGTPSTLEGKCVQDADRLDALGAIGIARTFAFGGSRGRAIHDPDGFDPQTSIQHFYDKLLRLKDLMNTSCGRRFAQQRDQFMHSFMDEFYGEWDGVR